jgi:hypothetical protein
MKIEYKEVPELLNIFKSYWSNNYHIKFEWRSSLDYLYLINVKVNDTDKGGQGEENWTLEYAYTVLKTPKEMELFIKRWKDGFKNAKKKPTLDIEGHKVDESTLN